MFSVLLTQTLINNNDNKNKYLINNDDILTAKNAPSADVKPVSKGRGDGTEIHGSSTTIPPLGSMTGLNGRSSCSINYNKQINRTNFKKNNNFKSKIKLFFLIENIE